MRLLNWIGRQKSETEIAFKFAEKKLLKAKAQGSSFLSLCADGAINETADWFQWGHYELEHLKFLPTLEGYGQLLELDISSTKISKLNGLASAPQLERLYASGCPIKTLLGIEELCALRSLDLHQTQVTQITEIKEFSKLETLDLSSTKVKDLLSISECINLLQLDLSHSKVRELEPISSLSKLESLSIDNLELADSSIFQHLTSLKKLTIDEEQIDLVLSAELSNDIKINLHVHEWSTIAVGLNSAKLEKFKRKPERLYLTELTRKTDVY